MRSTNHLVRLRSILSAGLVAASLARCNDDPAPAAAPRPPVVVAPTCASPDEAPLRAGDGSHPCARLGAVDAAGDDAWPTGDDDPTPVVYVRDGASGDGTRDAPYGDLATALAATPGTVRLARGAITVSSPVAIRRAVRVRGVGRATSLTAPGGAFAVEGAGASLTLIGVSIHGGAAGSSAVAATGDVTVRARDVSIDQPGRGIALDAATLCAERVTVSRAQGVGVLLSGGARGYLRGSVVRGGASAGVLVARSSVWMRDMLVAENLRDGVAVVGAAAGDACATDADCAPSPACEGFLDGVTRARACAAELRAGATARRCVDVSVIDRAALTANTGVGLRAQRAAPTDDERRVDEGAAVLGAPGPVVRASGLVVAATRATSAGAGGDGIYVGSGASLALDAALDPSRGAVGSEVIQSARAGVLLDGDRTTDVTVPNRFRAAGALDAVGARIASNGGPGVFAQQRATLTRLRGATVIDNAALGLAVTTGATLATLQDNQFLGTRAAEVLLEGGAARATFGDGVSLDASSGREALLQDNQFIDNARAGLLVAGGAARLAGANTGAGNGYGVALVAGASLRGDAAAVRGGATAPATLTYAQQSLAVTVTVTP